MTLQPNEYEITHKGSPYESIEINKTALEEWRDHHLEFAKSEPTATLRMYQAGRADMLIDLLKHFDELEVL